MGTYYYETFFSELLNITLTLQIIGQNKSIVNNKYIQCYTVMFYDSSRVFFLL